LFAAFKAAQYWLARFHFRELLQMHALTPDQLMAGIRRSQREEPDSGIMQAINHGFGRQGLIPLWAGEGHLPTPDFICNAAIASLQAGETFYTWQRGLPELREALARLPRAVLAWPVLAGAVLCDRRRHAGHPDRAAAAAGAGR
jgi:hypothetical protein